MNNGPVSIRTLLKTLKATSEMTAERVQMRRNESLRAGELDEMAMLRRKIALEP
jgi:hypothetical protein